MKPGFRYFFSFYILLIALSGCDKDRQAPSCNISAPEDKAEFDIGNTIEISVETYNPNDSPLEVMYYANDIEIGRSNTSPHTFEWNTAYEEEGKHLIRAKAKNDKGSSSSNEIELSLIRGIIPIVEVDIFKHLYSPPIIDMRMGETIFLEGGFSGIILYRDSTFYFTAIDRTCTLWPDHTSAVVPSPALAIDAFVCPVCNSLYDHTKEGKLISGPAQDPLVKYKTLVNRNTLYITNQNP